MSDRKLTEAEMISYLEFSVALGSTASLAPEEAQRLLDLINRQKAQIESLKKIGDDKTSEVLRYDASIRELHKQLETARSEAVKEFADRVDKKFAQCQREYRNVLNNDGACAMIIARKVVVDFAKEMTEERTE